MWVQFYIYHMDWYSIQLLLAWKNGIRTISGFQKGKKLCVESVIIYQGNFPKIITRNTREKRKYLEEFAGRMTSVKVVPRFRVKRRWRWRWMMKRKKMIRKFRIILNAITQFLPIKIIWVILRFFQPPPPAAAAHHYVVFFYLDLVNNLDYDLRVV